MVVRQAVGRRSANGCHRTEETNATSAAATAVGIKSYRDAVGRSAAATDVG